MVRVRKALGTLHLNAARSPPWLNPVLCALQWLKSILPSVKGRRNKPPGSQYLRGLWRQRRADTCLGRAVKVGGGHAVLKESS